MIVFSILFVIRTIAGMDHDSPYIDSSDNVSSVPESTTESRLKLNVVRYLNSPFAYTTNACRNRTSNQYYLYAQPFHQSSPSSYNRNCIKSLEMRTQFSAGVGRTAGRLKAFGIVDGWIFGERGGVKGNPLEGESMRLSDIRETMRMSIVYTK